MVAPVSIGEEIVAVPSPFETFALWGVMCVAIAALIYAVLLARDVLREPKGSGRMLESWMAVKDGANAYLKRQFKSILYIIGLLAVVLYVSAQFAGTSLSISLGRAAAFLMGAFFSALVGYIGMNMAIQGNIRTAISAGKDFRKALRISYRAGTVTGMLTDGLGLFGGTLIFTTYLTHAPEVLLGFGFGGTLLALFMRVGGGIYTKAADMGADLVGKVEKGIPEDDPRNAAVVADLVGDNVGDCAGMAADIFESYEVTMVSAMILGLIIKPFEFKWVIYPLVVRAIGVISTIIGTYMVPLWPEKWVKKNAFKAMDLSYDLSAAITIISSFLLAHFYVGDLRAFLAIAVGVALAMSFNKLADYFTSPYKKPVDEVAKSSRTGAAPLLLGGIALGFESTVWTLIVIAITIVVSVIVFTGAGIVFAMYGVALAGIGMLTLTGNNLAMDSFGPIVDNAGGIAEMSQADPETKQALAALDEAGNTTKAVTKVIAIASAVLAAIALFSSYAETIGAELVGLNIAEPLIFTGLLLGGAIPFLFSSVAIRAVRRGASKIIEVVREEFRRPGVMEGKTRPNYGRVVDIATFTAQRELVTLALMGILTPIVVGLLLGELALGAFLAGAILTGQLLAVFMANTGAAWDNAKKKIEEGHYGGKGSEEHKAAVIGDTVGDPLKDTAGPALNPMIKVINLVSMLFAPTIIVLRSNYPVVAAILALILVAMLALVIMRSKRAPEELVKEEVLVEAKHS
ncbi:MAG: sodium-translocating pyrophosphatase [Nitrososphaeria archaeon]|nr:sodium-translocating pyrophosphatase [Aigarchaeota archaeon]MCX8187899.1 sodium-translocating pyrophosphatase [Nitrososphaeria archaeon]MDW8021928.1 sodium-translocating pyrophosphatase [Nitrososphaerota archaeon]